MLSLLAQLDSSIYEVNTVNGVEDESGLLATLGSLMLVFLIVGLVSLVGLWKTFEKAGVEGWKAIIPIYNAWILFEISGKPGWWALVGLGAIVPILGFVASIASFVLWVIAALELGKAFGKDTVFSVLGLILFPFVGFLMLGFGDAKYTKPVVKA